VRRKLVCISHAEGAAGEEVGRLVADRLGFVYVDEEIVARAAARGGIDPADVADEERRKSLLERVLVGLAGRSSFPATGIRMGCFVLRVGRAM